jgi:hypothetical protein
MSSIRIACPGIPNLTTDPHGQNGRRGDFVDIIIIKKMKGLGVIEDMKLMVADKRADSPGIDMGAGHRREDESEDERDRYSLRNRRPKLDP